MSDTQLKPCPFCGNREIDYILKPYKKYKGVQFYECIVKCGNIYSSGCTAQVSQASSNKEKAKEYAFARWNTRLPIDVMVEKLEEEVMQAHKDVGLTETYHEACECNGRSAAYKKSIKIVKECDEV